VRFDTFTAAGIFRLARFYRYNATVTPFERCYFAHSDTYVTARAGDTHIPPLRRYIAGAVALRLRFADTA